MYLYIHTKNKEMVRTIWLYDSRKNVQHMDSDQNLTKLMTMYKYLYSSLKWFLKVEYNI